MKFDRIAQAFNRLTQAKSELWPAFEEEPTDMRKVEEFLAAIALAAPAIVAGLDALTEEMERIAKEHECSLLGCLVH